MKKVIIAALLLVGTATFAQQENKKNSKREQVENLTPEQRNQLHLKRMTLDLGLNESQQKEMRKIIAEQSVKREAAMAERKANQEKDVKPTADQRFAKKNQMLDDEIATNAKVKKILNPDQFDKWKKKNEKNRAKMKHMMQKKGKKMHQHGNEHK